MVLGEANAAVWEKLGPIDSPDRMLDELAKLISLRIGDRGLQVLHFHHSLANKDNLGNFGNAGDPRITNQLRVES
jgi:hypothetical protein